MTDEELCAIALSLTREEQETLHHLGDSLGSMPASAAANRLKELGLLDHERCVCWLTPLGKAALDALWDAREAKEAALARPFDLVEYGEHVLRECSRPSPAFHVSLDSLQISFTVPADGSAPPPEEEK